MARWAVLIASTDISGREACGHEIAERRPGAPGIVGGRDPPAFDQKAADQDREDHDQDQRGLARVDQLLAAATSQRRAAGHADADDRQHAEDVDDQRLEDEIELARA